jgi:hypothetical protein
METWVQTQRSSTSREGLVSPPSPQWQEENNLTRATHSFAQFFNGVIVDLDTGTTEVEDEEDEEGTLTAKLPTPELSTDEVDDVD